MVRRFLQVIVGASLLIGAVSIEAHSGRTDKSGCHKQKSTGTYHCHKKKR